MINSKDLSNIYQSLVSINLKTHDKATAIRLARATLLELISSGKKAEDLNLELDSEFNSDVDEDSNIYLESIFDEMSIVNGSNSLFGNIDFDEDELLTDEELIDFSEKDDEEKELIMDDMDFIFKSIDADGDGMINQAEMDTLNGGLAKDGNAEAVKKLMVMMDMNIEDSVKEAIQSDIDMMYENHLLLEDIEEKEIYRSDFKPSTSPDRSNATNNSDYSTPEDISAEISKKEAEKQKVISKAEQQIAREEEVIKEFLSRSVSEDQIATYETQKAEYDTNIASQDTIITQSTTIIQNKTAQLGGIDSTIAEYTNQIKNLNANKAQGDTTDTERITRIDGKIGNLQAAIDAENAKIAGLQAEIQAEQQKIDTAKQEKERLETEKNNLLNKLLEENKENFTLNNYNRIKKAQETIANINAKKEQDVAKLDAEIQTLKIEQNKLERKEESDKLIDENKESNFDENGKRIGLRDWPETAEEYAMYGLKSQSAIDAFEKCDQRLKEAYIDLSDWCREQGIYIQVNSSYRSRAQQEALWDGGNNPKAAKPGSSLHERGRAIDLRPYELDRTTRRRDSATYEMMGRYWTNVLGYSWGGDWQNNTEEWHFEIRK